MEHPFSWYVHDLRINLYLPYWLLELRIRTSNMAFSSKIVFHLEHFDAKYVMSLTEHDSTLWAPHPLNSAGCPPWPPWKAALVAFRLKNKVRDVRGVECFEAAKTWGRTNDADGRRDVRRLSTGTRAWRILRVYATS